MTNTTTTTTTAERRVEEELKTGEIEKPTPTPGTPEWPSTVTTLIPPPPTPLPNDQVVLNPLPPAPAGGRQNSTAMNIALGVGAVGVGMGAMAAAAGDGGPEGRFFAISSLGVGLAGFATAGILYATESTGTPESKKGVKVSAGPGMLGVRGRF